MNKQLIGHLLALALLLVLPFIGGYPIFIMKVLCYALFACAFNLLLGYTGYLSFGHSAFLGVGAYAAGFVLVYLGFSTIFGLIIGTLVATLFGLVFGWLSINRSGIYFAMITLALSQMLYFYFLQSSWTGGVDGLQNIPRGNVFGIDMDSDINLYYLVVIVFVVGYLAIWRIVHSPFGQALEAVRENSARMISLGYDVRNLILVAFVISAAVSGLAGAMKALVFTSATLSDATWHMSGTVVLIALIGGVGTLTGPVVGALIVVALESKIGEIGRFLADYTGVQWFKVLGESVTIVIGIIFVICVMAFRRGIVGELVHFRKKASTKTIS